MAAPTTRRPRATVRRDQQRRVRRARRIGVAILLASVLVPTLLLTAFGGGSTPLEQAAPARAARLVPAGPPRPQVVSLYDDLRLQLPVAQSRVTAVGYGSGSAGALALTPVGTQANAGLVQRLWQKLAGSDSAGFRWFQLPGRRGAATSALDVGAEPGTDAYAPVDGTIVGLSDLILNGRPYGQRIEIQPASAPSIVVVVSHVKVDASLAVGSGVVAGATKLGTVLDFSSVERQALSDFTADAGNHVLVEVHPAATLAVS